MSAILAAVVMAKCGRMLMLVAEVGGGLPTDTTGCWGGG